MISGSGTETKYRQETVNEEEEEEEDGEREETVPKNVKEEEDADADDEAELTDIRKDETEIKSSETTENGVKGEIVDKQGR